MTEKFTLKGLIKGNVNAKGKPGRFVGIATSNSLDMEGEIVDPDGLNWDYALSRGFLVDTHDDSTSERAIGIIEKVKREGNKWLIYGMFLDTPRARKIWPVIVEAAKHNHPLGLSIEGIPREVQGDVIKKADVVNVAVTPNPVNPDATIEPLYKSLDKAMKATGLSVGDVPDGLVYNGGAALVKQNLQGSVAKETLDEEVGMPDKNASLEAFVDALSDKDKQALLSLLKEDEGKTEDVEVKAPENAETDVEVKPEETPEGKEKEEAEVEKGVNPEEEVEDFEAAVAKALGEDEDYDADAEAEVDEEGGADEDEIDVNKDMNDVMNAPANGDAVEEQKYNVDNMVDVGDALNNLIGGLEKRMGSVEASILKLAEAIKGLNASVKKSLESTQEMHDVTTELQKSIETLPIGSGTNKPKSVAMAKGGMSSSQDIVPLLKGKYGTSWLNVLTMKLTKALEKANAERRVVDVDEIGQAMMNLNHGELPSRAFLLKHGIEE